MRAVQSDLIRVHCNLNVYVHMIIISMIYFVIIIIIFAVTEGQIRTVFCICANWHILSTIFSFICRATDNFLDNRVFSVFELNIFTPQNKNNWVKFKNEYKSIKTGLISQTKSKYKK